MKAWSRGKRVVVAAMLGNALLGAATSCSSDSTKKAVLTPGGAGAGDGGAAGEPVVSGTAGDAGQAGAPAGGNASEGGASGEPGAAGQPSVGGTAGTGGSAGTGGAAGSPAFTTIAEADFEATFAKIFCDSVAHCCTGGVATCVDTETTDFAKIHTTAKTANNVYNPMRAAQCANAIVAFGQSAQCSTFFASTQESLRPCRSVFDGTVAPGDECTDVTDCKQSIADDPVKGGYSGCSVLNDSGPKRCRKFVPTATPGAACTNSGAFTGAEAIRPVCANTLSCVANQCVTLPTAGQPCPGGSCYDAVCKAGTCAPLQQETQSCADAQCEFGLDCTDANVCAAEPASPWILDVGFFDTTYKCPT